MRNTVVKVTGLTFKATILCLKQLQFIKHFSKKMPTFGQLSALSSIAFDNSATLGPCSLPHP